MPVAPEVTPDARPRVLLAINEPATRAGLRLALEEAGLAVAAEVETGDAAVSVVLSELPDVVLLASRLGNDGLGAVRRILEKQPDCRVVILAHTLDAQEFLEAMRAGAVGYLGEDVDPNRLPDVLRAVIGGEAAVPRRFVLQLAEEVRGRDRLRSLVTERGTGRLTEREWETLVLLERGLSTAEIAARLGISEVTVRRHVSSLLARLGLPSRAAAVELLRSTR